MLSENNSESMPMQTCTITPLPLWRFFAIIQVSLLSVMPADVRADLDESIPLRIINHQDRETVRYPIVLLKGELADKSQLNITATNTSNRKEQIPIPGVVHEGNFKVLCELVPGVNRIRIAAGDNEHLLTLIYRRQTNPFVYRMVWVVDASGNTDYQTPFEDDPQDFREKLDLQAKLLQTFIAEQLYDYGYERRTINWETGPDGRVKVYVVRGPKTIEQYLREGETGYDARSMGGGNYAAQTSVREAVRAVDAAMPDTVSRRAGPMRHVYAVQMLGFARWLPEERKTLAEASFSGGGNLTLSAQRMWAFPGHLKDAAAAFTDESPYDPAIVAGGGPPYRRQRRRAAGAHLGILAHELAHTFRLPHSVQHDCILASGPSIMERFFTLEFRYDPRERDPRIINPESIPIISPVVAGVMALSPRTQLDAVVKESVRRPMDITFDPRTETITVTCANGVASVSIVGAIREDGPAGLVISKRPDPGASAPPALSITLAEIRRAEVVGDFRIWIHDGHGWFHDLKFSKLVAERAGLATSGETDEPAGNNLLADLQVDDHVLRGEWKIDDGVLTTPAGTRNQLKLIRPPGPEYTVDLNVTRVAPGSGLTLNLPYGPARMTIFVDESRSGGRSATGIDKLRGKPITQSQVIHQARLLPPGKTLRIQIQVRRGEVSLTANDELIFSWKGRHQELEPSRVWNVEEEPAIVLGSQGRFQIDRLLLLPREIEP